MNRSEKILELLKDGAISSAEVLINCALVPLMTPYKGMAPLIKQPISFTRKEKQRIYSMLSRLQSQGLVVATTLDVGKKWSLTKSGAAVLEKQKKARNPYDKVLSKEVVVISYDIPESYKKERDWLRSSLKFLEFQLVHKSVWIGKFSLPKNFITDLELKGIDEYVHIFSMGKEGTLRKCL